MPESTRNEIHGMFKSLERPVIVRQHNENKRIEAQMAVQAVVRKYACYTHRERERKIYIVANFFDASLEKRLAKVPFPPATSHTNFQYEVMLDEHVRYHAFFFFLETKLSTVTDGIEILQAEIGKEEALLAEETKQLQELDKNAKGAESERKRQMKNVIRHIYSYSITY